MTDTDAQTHIEVLKALSSLRPRPFLMGGFAEDALVHGRVTRLRNDLDLLVDRADWPEVSRQLRVAGLPPFEPSITAPDGTAVAFLAATNNIPVEVWLCERWDGGYGLVLPGESSDGRSPAFFRLLLPADTFAFPAAELDGGTVQTVSPLALALLRAASARTRGSEEHRAADRGMASLLAQRFLSDRDAAGLEPQLKRLE